MGKQVERGKNYVVYVYLFASRIIININLWFKVWMEDKHSKSKKVSYTRLEGISERYQDNFLGDFIE